MENRVAIITGAARGIGKATAQAFIREGASVAIADLNMAVVSGFERSGNPDTPYPETTKTRR